MDGNNELWRLFSQALPFFLFIVLPTSLWVFFDARRLGVKQGQMKHHGAKSWSDSPPSGWLAGCLILWTVFFPLYLIRRPEYKRINRPPQPHISPPLIPQPLVAAPSLSQDFDQQLRKLSKLKEDGVITEEEFEHKKKLILNAIR
jgi:hypothetical protein